MHSDGPGGQQSSVTDQNSPDPLGLLAQRVSGLREAGGEAFDPVGLSHVERLARRAEGVGGAGGQHLARRALAALERIHSRYDASRRQALLDLERLDRLGLDPSDTARSAFQRGDLTRVRRIARRRPQTEPRLRDQLHRQWQTALGDEVERRGISSPGTILAPGATDLDVQEPSALELAVALYRNTAASTDAARTIEHALSTLPEQAGPYHSGTIAARTLQAMQAAPPYLHSQLARLEVFAALEDFAAKGYDED